MRNEAIFAEPYNLLVDLEIDDFREYLRSNVQYLNAYNRYLFPPNEPMKYQLKAIIH